MEMMMNENDGAYWWSDLQFDLLAQIIDKVISSSSLVDHIRFGCICVQWRSFFIENYEQIKLSNLPVLLIPSFNHHHHSNIQNQEEEKEEEELEEIVFHNYYNPKVIWLGLDHNQRHRNTRNFYSLSERKVYDFQLQVPSYMNCRGSSHGWLVVVEECTDGTCPVHLLNPFRSSDKHNKIKLPPLNPVNHITSPAFHSFFLEKAIFNRDPSSSSSSSLFQSNPTTNTDDFVVLGLYGDSRMGFCRPGEAAWTSLPSPQAIPYRSIVDVVCYKGQFWGILQNGTAFAFDIAPEPKVTIVVDPHPEDDPVATTRYIVESAGDLFNVRRKFYYPDEVNYSTVGFQVFKLDQTEMEWVKTNTLDGRMFFLGNNTSMSLSPSHYIHESCKPNSIYFTDDYEDCYLSTPWVGPHDMGVFNLEDGSIEPHYMKESKTIMPTAIWIQPML